MAKNGDRVIITADLLLEYFGHLGLDLLIFILAPFALPEGRAFEEFDRVIKMLDEVSDQPGKKDAVGAFKDLRNAYLKMSVFERESVRKDLPKKMAEFIIKSIGN